MHTCPEPPGLGRGCGIDQCPTESARFIRPAGLPGIEALHATFVDHRYPPHIHDAFTIALVDVGAAAFDLDGKRHLAPAGSVFVIPPHAVHTGQAATHDGYRYRVLYLEPQQLPGPSEDPGRDLLCKAPTVLNLPALSTAVGRVHQSLEPGGGALAVEEALVSLSSRLVALTGSAAGERVREHAAVACAREYIHAHWSENFTLTQLAAAAHLSPYHLSRSFRQQVGASPLTYRRALRIEAAQRLLRRGVPPARVANECGFYDQAHLNQHFKRTIGVTPSRYARATTGN